MGYVYVRKGQCYIAYKRPDGRWMRESAGTDKKTEARALLSKREQDMFKAKASGLPLQSELRLEEFVKEYLRHAEANKKATSFKRDQTSLKRLLPKFGKMKLREITAGMIQRYADERRLDKGKGGKRLRAATVTNELHTLSAIYREAVLRDLVQVNPVSRVKKPKEENTIVRYLSADEDQRLYAAVPARIEPLITVALHTGLRKGELLKLEWSDVDFDQKILLVKNTKSKRRRYVPLNALVVEKLKSLPSAKDSPYVFIDPTSKEAILDIERAWRKTLSLAKIQNFRFHDLRHTFASRLVQRGVSIQVVKELLGHSDITTTMRYAHLAPIDLIQATDKLSQKPVVEKKEQVAPPAEAEKKEEPRS
jgi:integrase